MHKYFASRTVAERLVQRDFTHHVFRTRTRRMHRGRLVDVLTPAFPRYLFVIVPDARWDELHSIEGIAGYVRDGAGTPARVPNGVAVTG